MSQRLTLLSPPPFSLPLFSKAFCLPGERHLPEVFCSWWLVDLLPLSDSLSFFFLINSSKGKVAEKMSFEISKANRVCFGFLQNLRMR